MRNESEHQDREKCIVFVGNLEAAVTSKMLAERELQADLQQFPAQLLCAYEPHHIQDLVKPDLTQNRRYIFAVLPTASNQLKRTVESVVAFVRRGTFSSEIAIIDATGETPRVRGLNRIVDSSNTLNTLERKNRLYIHIKDFLQ